jgi:Protein kinase domain
MRAGLVLEGRYRLDALLGTGGMGEVWQGTDLRLGRLVAVKVMLDSWARQQQALARFLREGQAAAGLDHHPAIAAVHDFGEDDGHPFLVMELLRGETFQALLARNPDGIPVHDVVSFGIQIADGLAAAHAAGVIHRDIKPANLMLLPGGRVKICDFGIARVEAVSGQLTVTGDAVGTPAYMAPEQWQGLPVDGRADLYSLGCVLYGMAAGHAAFRPGPRPALEPSALDALLTGMLATDPGQRPATAAIVTAALRSIADRRQHAAAAARVRTLRLLTDAEHIALTVDSRWRRLTLFCDIAQVAATPDPDLARRLLAEAEIIASTYPDPWRERHQILKVMAGLDLGEAGRILRGFTEPDKHEQQVSDVVDIAVAQAAAERDPDAAKRILADVACIARTVTDPRARGWRLQEIAEVAISRDPDAARRLLAEAEQIARTLADPSACSEELRMIAQATMALDTAEARRLLAEAERTARTVTQTPEQARSILRIAEIGIGFDDDLTRRLAAEIEHLASTVTDGRLRDALLEETAGAIAKLDPGEAGRIAAAMDNEERRRFILWWMARDVTARDPSGALQLLAEATRLSQAAGHSYGLMDITAVMAGIDPDLAEQTARTIPDEGKHCEALQKIAETVGAREPRRARRLLAEAEQLAPGIGHPQRRAESLSQIARLLVPFGTDQARRVLAEAGRAARSIPAGFLDTSDTEGTATEIAKALAVSAPGEAERLAQGLHHERDNAILEVAKVIGATDTDAAIRAVRAISGQDKHMQALADLAACMAERDLSEAERIAGKISQPEYHARALVRIAEAAARQGPGWN